MITLFLLRHAKSSWKHEKLLDIERPLNREGFEEADELCNWLQKNKLTINKVECSPSIRTYHTFLIANRELKINQDKIQLNKELYESSLENYLNVIKKNLDSNRNLMIVGHNPVITNLASFLCGYPKEVLTGSLLQINISKIKPNDVKKNCGNLTSEFIPSRHLNHGKI
jgi:phosphohistidine phosphatase